MEKKTKIKQEDIIAAIGAVLIFLLHALILKKVYYPYITDEFGYWGVAASINGLDWSGAMTNIPYYSYGYSFIIAFLLKIFKDTVLTYKIQIALNGIFLSASYLIAYSISCKLFENVNQYYKLISAMVCALYTSHIALSATGLTESLLILLCWINLYFVIKYVQSGKTQYMILIFAISIYAYVVHQRMLAMIFATVMTIIFKVSESRKINIKKIIKFILLILAVVLISLLLKNFIKDNVWGNADQSYTDINDYSVQIEKVKSLIKPKVMLEAIKEGLGQLFYIGMATFLIAYIGLAEIIKKAYACFKNKERNNLIYVYELLLFMGLFAISTVYYAARIDRADQAVYGRYIEVCYGFLLLCGCIKLYNIKNNYFKIFGLIPVIGAVSIIIDKRIAEFGVGDKYSEGSAAALAWFYKEQGLSMKMTALILTCISALIIALCIWKNKIFSYVAISIFILYNIIMGMHVRDVYVAKRQEIYNDNIIITDKIKEIGDDIPIYCMDSVADASARWVDFVQFMFPDKTIRLAGYEEIINDKEEKYVLAYAKNDLISRLGMGDAYDIVNISGEYILYLSKGDKNNEYGKSDSYLDDNEKVKVPLYTLTMLNSEYDAKEKCIMSNGMQGRMFRGLKQKTAIMPYEFIYDMHLYEHTQDTIGRFIIYTDGKIYKEKVVKYSDFVNGEYRAVIPYNSTKECYLEIIFETTKGSVAGLKGLTITAER